jgi:hypothetical protein
MKYSKYIFISLLTVLFFTACKEDEVGPVIHLNGAPQITAPTAGTAFLLTEAESDSLIPAMSWTAADWGLDVPTRYILEIDQAGNNFEDAVALYTGSALAISNLTVADLNNVLVGMDLPFEVAADMEIRVIATTGSDSNTGSSTLGTDAPPQISNVVTISVTPFEANKVIPELQVPGSYQGWNPGDTTTVLFSVENDGLYEGYVYISPDASFYKFTQGLSWDVNWGDNGNDGTLEPNGSDIPAAVAGVYKLNVNLPGLTHTQTLTNWGLIGNATPGGWDTDTDMVYDAGTRALTLTVDLVAGAIKFRANDDWAINLGDNGNNLSLEYGGADIPVAEAGNYTINLYIVGVSKYTYTITKN